MTIGFGGQNGYPSLLLGQQHSPNTPAGTGAGGAAPFSGAAVLARLLEGGDQPGELSAALANHGNDLRATVASLSATQRSALENRFGAAGLTELYDLAGERDAALF